MSKLSHRGRKASPEKQAAVFSGDQRDLFERLEVPAIEDQAAVDLDIGPELTGAINTAIRNAKAKGLSRERIVDQMNQLMPDLPKSITKRQLDCWTAGSVDYSEFPARYLAAFCRVTGCEQPLRLLAQVIGFDLVDARERLIKELGEAEMHAAINRRAAHEIKKTLVHGV
jgi:hypothetical protein